MAVQQEILSRLKPRIQKLGRPPGLAVVLVGHDPASEIYVRSKIKACAELGIFSEKLTPAETATTEELVALVEELNVMVTLSITVNCTPSIYSKITRVRALVAFSPKP